jgi:hypothetical protein
VGSLPSKKKDPQKKREGSKDGKVKEVKPHMKSSMYKKRDDEIYMMLGEILSKERKEITFSYSAKSNVWHHQYTHIICSCTTFYFLTFSFLTPTHYTILHQP